MEVQQIFRFWSKLQRKYSSPQLEIILSVITPIPAGHKTSACLFLCHIWASCTPPSRLYWLCQASVRGGGGVAFVDPGEEQDEVIRTSQGIRLICYTLLKVGPRICMNKRCPVFYLCVCVKYVHEFLRSFSTILCKLHDSITVTFNKPFNYILLKHLILILNCVRCNVHFLPLKNSFPS